MLTESTLKPERRSADIVYAGWLVTLRRYLLFVAAANLAALGLERTANKTK